MKRFAYLTLAALVATSALWLYSRRNDLQLQWDCYEVTSAATYEEFRQRIDHFLRGSSAYERLRALADRWHTGNARFDDFLARYLFDPQCREPLREAFSRELSWRDLLAAWAEHWRAQKPDVEHQVASIRRYLGALRDAQPPREITWRDVLDFQAVLELSGQGKLAHRLTPDNWRGRYGRWRAAAEGH